LSATSMMTGSWATAAILARAAHHGPEQTRRGHTGGDGVHPGNDGRSA
jgi:hypothetical protein